MHIEWLYAFLEAAECGSFLKASERLNMTQPGLSKQIAKLEEDVGFPLFKRSTSGLELTEHGRVLQKRAVPIISAIDDLKEELKSIGENSGQRMLIGSISSIATYYLPEKANRMKEEGIDFNLTVLHSSVELLNKLKRNLLDVIVIEDVGVPDIYWRQTLLVEHYYLLTRPDHVLSDRDGVFLKDIRQERLIVYPSGCDVRSTIEEGYQRMGIPGLNIAMETNFNESILHLVESGAGVAIVPRLIAENESRFDLCFVPIADLEPRTIIVMSRDKACGEKIYRLFMEEGTECR